MTVRCCFENVCMERWSRCVAPLGGRRRRRARRNREGNGARQCVSASSLLCRSLLLISFFNLMKTFYFSRPIRSWLYKEEENVCRREKIRGSESCAQQSRSIRANKKRETRNYVISTITRRTGDYAVCRTHESRNRARNESKLNEKQRKWRRRRRTWQRNGFNFHANRNMSENKPLRIGACLKNENYKALLSCSHYIVHHRLLMDPISAWRWTTYSHSPKKAIKKWSLSRHSNVTWKITGAIRFQAIV